MLEIKSVRHAFPEGANRFVKRPQGIKEYTFIHFTQPVEIEYRGKMIETLPHSIIVYDIDTPQYYRWSTPLLQDWMHWTGDMSDFLLENGIELNTVYYPTQHSFITDLTWEIETEFYNSKRNSEHLIRLKFEELFIKLGRSISGETGPAIALSTKQQFHQLRGKLFSNLDEHWTIERIAQETGYSKSRVFAIYKALYGISPTSDLINARINTSKSLLTQTNTKIDEIAQSLGYENTTHFIRQFKEKMEMSPSAYRKQFRSEESQ